MEQEDKAKRFDEIIKRIRGMMPSWERLTYTGKTFLQDLTHIIPELRESEDEKIKDSLRKCLESLRDDAKWSNFYGISFESIFAWLERQGNDSYLQEKIENFTNAHKGEDPEDIIAACRGYVKQGEQKPANKEYTFNAIPRLLEMIQPTDRAKSYCQKLIDSLEQEGYSTDAKIVRERLKLMNGEIVAMATMDEQKPAEWSVEDKVKLNRIVTCLENLNVADNDILLKDVAWLLSLKDRVQSQPKQEWSERDKEEFQIVIGTLVEAGQHDSAQWLKSLNPQPHWKPSKEQIIALRWVLNNIPYNKHKEEISGLLDQIKDL